MDSIVSAESVAMTMTIGSYINTPPPMDNGILTPGNDMINNLPIIDVNSSGSGDNEEMDDEDENGIYGKGDRETAGGDDEDIMNGITGGDTPTPEHETDTGESGDNDNDDDLYSNNGDQERVTRGYTKGNNE